MLRGAVVLTSQREVVAMLQGAVVLFSQREVVMRKYSLIKARRRRVLGEGSPNN